tara:strand:+ start:16271 stop:16510 length:240 start_codon:yes stop_codon:yes gene_type:complete
MKLSQLLIGKKVKIMTDMKVEVELTIESVKDTSWQNQITPDTRENDWWGQSETIQRWTVTFTNGATKEYKSLDSINFEE